MSKKWVLANELRSLQRDDSSPPGQVEPKKETEAEKEAIEVPLPDRHGHLFENISHLMTIANDMGRAVKINGSVYGGSSWLVIPPNVTIAGAIRIYEQHEKEKESKRPAYLKTPKGRKARVAEIQRAVNILRDLETPLQPPTLKDQEEWQRAVTRSSGSIRKEIDIRLAARWARRMEEYLVGGTPFDQVAKKALDETNIEGFEEFQLDIPVGILRQT